MKTYRYALAGVCLCMLSTAAVAADEAAAKEQAIEEVVVTGSYLKRTAQDSPSPISVVTSADIEDIGAADVAEIVATLPWQSGSQTRAATFQGEGADGRNSINLRNLGHGATLPLVNGKRQVPSWYGPSGDASVNINGLVPNIAIERIEIVKDGSSALYGSDAIAGVVNFLTKKEFEGMDVNYQYTVDEETGEGRVHEIEGMWGIQGDRGGIVASASFMDRGEINIADRYDRFGGSSASSTGQPGRLVPRGGQTIRWAAHGLNPGQPVAGNRYPRNPQGTLFGQADVDCENSSALEEGGPIGVVLGGNVCAYDFGSFFALQGSEQLTKFHVTGHYDFTDSFEAYFEFAANDSEFDRLNSLNPNAPSLPIAATHPGAIEDAFRRGIEPISVNNLTRLLGGTRFTPKEDRPLDTFTQSNYSDQRLVIGALWDLELAGRDWTLDASVTKSEHDAAITQVQDTQSAQMLLAINGRGGPNCNPITGTPGEGNLAYAASGGNFAAGRCYYFNPFGNSAFGRTGGEQTNLALVNPAELYQWLAGRASNDSVYRETVMDAVMSGELFDMYNDLPVGLAVGFQRRKDTGGIVVDTSLKANNLDFAFGADDWDGKLTTTAYFAEIGIPLHETLDVNLAIRYEKFAEIKENTTDPKITVLWRPLDSFSVRASAGTSFRVPSMQQLFGSLTTVANQVDVLGDSAFRPSITTGNEDLKPESVDTWNVGFTYAPTDGFLEGFQVDIDYYSYKYKDIISRESSAAVLLADNQALQAAVRGGQTLVQAVNAGVGNRRQVVRNADGFLLRILPDFVNSEEADIDGIDISTSYRFETDYGMFRVGVQAAWAKTYDITVGNQTFDAVGQYNEFTPVARPLPEWKLNGSLSWSMDNHRAFMLVQYVDSVDYGIDLATDPRGGSARFWRETVALVHGADTAAKFFTRNIKSMTTVDLQYSYTFDELGVLGTSEISIGAKNVFNEEPPWVPVNTAYDGTLHDMRGRVWFLRVGTSL